MPGDLRFIPQSFISLLFHYNENDLPSHWFPNSDIFSFGLMTSFPGSPLVHYAHVWKSAIRLVAGSLESANSSILASCDHFKEVVGKKSGFYDN